MVQLAEAWRHRAVDGFRAAYRKTMRGCAAYPVSKKQARMMVAFFTLEKAVYEASYELANRPGWVDMPVFGTDGEPSQFRGVASSEPGLYFVGREFMYALSSAMIQGIGRDAEHIARQIATTSRTGAPARA